MFEYCSRSATNLPWVTQPTSFSGSFCHLHLLRPLENKNSLIYKCWIWKEIFIVKPMVYWGISGRLSNSVELWPVLAFQRPFHGARTVNNHKALWCIQQIISLQFDNYWIKFRYYYFYGKGFGIAFSRKQRLKLSGIHSAEQVNFIYEGVELWRFLIVRNSFLYWNTEHACRKFENWIRVFTKPQSWGFYVLEALGFFVLLS